jgi:two-component system phosphate regulon sensor histidine kinase PhoR
LNAVAEESIESLKTELERKSQRIAQLEKINKDLNEKVQGAAAQPAVDLTELEKTLTGMLTRTAMILQGTKCLYLVQDPNTKELFPGKPAIGFEEADLIDVRIPAGAGLSGSCFASGEPTFLYDVETDNLASQENFSSLGVKNGLAFPLVVEKRDEDTNQVVERRTVGVLWVFNKRGGGIFSDEDVFLFRTLAARMAAVINQAKFISEIVEEKEQLHEMTDALTAGLIMIGRNGRVLQMNASARRVFGLGPSETLGAKTYDQIIKNDEVRDVLKKAIDEQTDIEEEVALSDAEEASRTFQIQSTMVRNEAGEVMGTAAIFNDITELKNIDKMKTAFVSTVSHELRTPMTSIKGFVSTLLMDEDGTMFANEERVEFYGIIDKECDRLRRLIDDLLNVSRIEAGASMQLEFDKMDLHETVKRVVQIDNGSTYKKDNHTLTYEIADAVPAMIDADADKFEQILHNVIGNALKYSPDGGNVKVHVGMESPDTLLFAVSDEGLGMTPEFLKKFGEKFARADNRDTRSINGTGIGIFLVKNFIEGHGGRMWPHSEGLGKGTTIYFTMPVHQHEDAPQGSLAASVAG